MLLISRYPVHMRSFGLLITVYIRSFGDIIGDPEHRNRTKLIVKLFLRGPLANICNDWGPWMQQKENIEYRTWNVER
jgi:hypothetical protein